jgi:hypothetical protein
MKSSSNGGLHNIVNSIEAFPKIGRNARNVPTKSECDVFVCSSTELETKSCCNAIGMGDDTLDMNTAVVLGIGVSKAAGHSHVISNMTVAKHRICRTEVASKLRERLVRRDAEEASSTNNVNCRNDWVEWGVRLTSIFSNGKVLATFVETESEMKLPDVIKGCIETAELAIDLNSESIVENEVVGYKRKRLLGPRTSVSRIWNASVVRFGGGT